MSQEAGHLPFNDYGTWIRKQLGCRVQKLSVDAGLTCPNRDGHLSRGGCSFCDNSAFTPSYCQGLSGVKAQLEAGKAFYGRKYPTMRYLAYFQSYSNTYAPLDKLKRLYEEALSTEDVVGIVISTRPDCLPPATLRYLDALNRETFLIVEIGIESADDATLRRINRGHDFACSRTAIANLAACGIRTGGHVILGLPGEDEASMLQQAHTISQLPLTLLKLHHLQIIRGTQMAKAYEAGEISTMEAGTYLHVVAQYISRLRADLVLERQFTSSPLDKVLSPHWGLKPGRLTEMLCDYMRANELWQGKDAYFKNFS